MRFLALLISAFDYLYLYISTVIWVMRTLLSTSPLWIQILFGLLMTSPMILTILILYKMTSWILAFLKVLKMLCRIIIRALF
nr:TPA_asm: P overlapped [Pogostemom alphacytorhabdovirus 1_Pog]